MVVAAAAAGDETHIPIVAMKDTTVMTSMTDTGNIEYILQCGKHLYCFCEGYNEF